LTKVIPVKSFVLKGVRVLQWVSKQLFFFTGAKVRHDDVFEGYILRCESYNCIAF